MFLKRKAKKPQNLLGYFKRSYFLVGHFKKNTKIDLNVSILTSDVPNTQVLVHSITPQMIVRIRGFIQECQRILKNSGGLFQGGKRSKQVKII